MNKPSNPKERNLLKGAIRRVFSRSELRQNALSTVRIQHQDVNRPRVTRWGFCTECGLIEPMYLLQVDHKEPLVPLNKTLEDMTWDEVMDRMWCELENLRAICKPCHKDKTKAETKERKRLRGLKK